MYFWVLWVKKEHVIIPSYRCTFRVLWVQKGKLHIYNYTYLRLRQGCGNPTWTKGCEWRRGGSYAFDSNLKFSIKESAAWKLCLCPRTLGQGTCGGFGVWASSNKTKGIFLPIMPIPSGSMLCASLAVMFEFISGAIGHQLLLLEPLPDTMPEEPKP